jgi:glutathione S-transferase
MVENLIGKKINVERSVPNSSKALHYEGILLETNAIGIWLEDRYEGKIFLPFSQIIIREVREAKP